MMTNLSEFKTWASNVTSVASANTVLYSGNGYVGFPQTTYTDNSITFMPMTAVSSFWAPTEEAKLDGPLEWLRKRVGEICEAGSLELALI
jgi:hypothetical protein